MAQVPQKVPPGWHRFGLQLTQLVTYLIIGTTLGQCMGSGVFVLLIPVVLVLRFCNRCL